MTDRPIRVLPLAAEEAELARAWYWQRNPKISEEFLIELDTAMEAIAEQPDRWVRVGTRYRRYLLRNFPFSVVYLPLANSIEVIAIAHHRRRPGYWRGRR